MVRWTEEQARKIIANYGTLECQVCGKTVKKTNGRQKYCPVCAKELYGRRGTRKNRLVHTERKEPDVERTENICPTCGQRYGTDKGGENDPVVRRFTRHEAKDDVDYFQCRCGKVHLRWKNSPVQRRIVERWFIDE